MLKIAIDLVEPGMELGRPIYDLRGRTILSAGVSLTDRHVTFLKKWEVRHIWINDPLLSLPPVDEVMEAETRLRAVQTVRESFEVTKSTGVFKLTNDHRTILNDIVAQVIRRRTSILQLVQLQQHDDDLFAHSINVSVLATMITVALGNHNSQDLYSVATGAMLHDIGKILVPPEIVQNKGNLFGEEGKLYEAHTGLGFQLLRNTGEIPLGVCHIALQHHERMDGQGYPRQLDARHINRLARIVAIANEYDNLVTGKGHAGRTLPHLAYEKVVAGATTAFDPAAMQAFLSCVAVYPVGSVVKLSSGQIAVVESVVERIQHRPQVRVIGDERGKAVSEPYLIDLADKGNLTLFIDEIMDDDDATAYLRNSR